MEKQNCHRCSTKEYIPTHQYMKKEIICAGTRVNASIKYFCDSCWTLFRQQFYDPAAQLNTAPKPENNKTGVKVTEGATLTAKLVTVDGLRELEAWLGAGSRANGNVVADPC